MEYYCLPINQLLNILTEYLDILEEKIEIIFGETLANFGSFGNFENFVMPQPEVEVIRELSPDPVLQEFVNIE